MTRAAALLALLLCAQLAAAETTVLVAGATGRTGSLVVQELRRAGLKVRAMTRSSDSAAGFGAGIDGVVADVTDPATLAGAVKDTAIVISTIGARASSGDNSFATVDGAGNRALVDAARAAGVRQFLLVSTGSAGRQGGRYEDPNTPYPWKAGSEQHLRDSGMDYTIFAPGGLRDYAAGEKNIVLATRADYDTGQISRADLATLLVACIDNTDCFGKTITVVNGDAPASSAWRQQLAELPADR